MSSTGDGCYRIMGSSVISSDLEAQIGGFIKHYKQHRNHESLENLTPADIYLDKDLEHFPIWVNLRGFPTGFRI